MAPKKADLLFLTFIAAFFCLAGIGLGSLASWDEAYYALVSRGIFRSGDWVRLTFFDSPFFDKPPLYFWMTAGWYHLFGVNEFSTRLTSSLAGIGVILVTYLLGSKLLGRLAGLLGAGILLSSADFLHYARWGTLDVTHLLFFTSFIYLYLLTEEHPVLWLASWAVCALAVLTKGPLIVLAWMLVAVDSGLRNRAIRRPGHFFWLGLGLFALLVLPWHWAAYRSNPEVFVHDFLYKHYVSRTLGAVEGHAGNTYFYIRTLINKFHPWVFLAPGALVWAGWRIFKRPEKRAVVFLTGWVLLVFLFFTFAVRTKLKWYILPLHPALCLLIGGFAAPWLARVQDRWVKFALIAACALQIPFSSFFIYEGSPALKRLAPQVQKTVPPGGRVYLYNLHEQPAAVFYFDRQSLYLDSREEFEKALAEKKKLVIVMDAKKQSEEDKLFGILGFRPIERTEGLRQDLTLYSNG